MKITMTTMMPAFHRLFELPRELYLKVLFRVPLKYLIRLRCVSKLLLALTNNPKFIASYYLQSKANPNLLLDFNFIDTVPRPSSLLLLSPPSPSPSPSDLSSSTPPPPPPPPPPPINDNVVNQDWLWRFHILIKGSSFIYSAGKYHDGGLIPFRHLDRKLHLVSSSSNGLICLAGLNFLEIYNILSGANYLIEMDPPEIKLAYAACVFGFDPASNDYKIVCFNTFPKRTWWMFSFRTNSWKPLAVTISNSSTVWKNSVGGLTICIDGVIYWPLHPEDVYDGIGFVSFNLHKEEFVRIKPPPLDGIFPTILCSDLQLLSFKGCPSFVYIKRSRKVGGGKSRKGGPAASESCSSSSHSGGGGFRVELFILKNNGGGGGGRGDNGENNNEYWIRESIATPFSFPKEVQIVSLYDQIFLAWFEAKHLRLYNLHTKSYVNLPRSPPGVYYPKVSRSNTKHNPTYVDNLRFDFTLI